MRFPSREAVNRIGVPLILLAFGALLSLVALGQPLYTVTEEDQRDGTVTVSKFLGGQVTKETYAAGRLVEVEILPYDSPDFEELAMGPVLQVAFIASLALTLLLVLGTAFFVLGRRRARWQRYGPFLVLAAALAALASTIYLAVALPNPIGLNVDPAAGFLPGGMADANGALTWGPGIAWYAIAVVAILALVAFLFHIKEHGMAGWRATGA